VDTHGWRSSVGTGKHLGHPNKARHTLSRDRRSRVASRGALNALRLLAAAVAVSAIAYQYPFVDVDRHGYDGVAVRCVVIAIGMVAGAALVAWLGNVRSGAVRAQPAPAAPAT